MTTRFMRLTVGALALATLGLNACKKDETKLVVQTAGSPSLTASTAAPDLVLSPANANTAGVTFNFTPANFGYQSVNTYTVEIDKKGNNFAQPQKVGAGTLASSGSGSLTISKSQLANIFFNLGYASGATSQVEARVVASVGGTAPTQVSQVVTLTATPTRTCIPNTTGRTWSLIGPAGTDWSTDRPLTYDCNTQSFSATMVLKADEFKFRANNDWSVNFGTSGPTGSVTMAALAQGLPLVNNNNNLRITTAGTYTIVLTPSPDGTNGTVTIKP